MNRKLVFFLWLTLFGAVMALANCMPKSGSSRPGQSAPPPGPVLGGTSDQAGGGNMIKDKNGKLQPIDFFREDITKWPEYVKFIEPIDKKFSEVAFPHNQTLILHTMARSRTWYLVPIRQKELPPQQIGSPFASIQSAIQAIKEIFIFEPDLPVENLNGTLYRNEELTAKLLLHELVMTLYHKRFESAGYFCEMQTDEKVKAECTSAMANEIESPIMNPIQQDVYLTPGQYEPIRHFTSYLWENYSSMSREELWEKLTDKGFDPRIFNPTTLTGVKNPERQEHTNISREALLRRLKVQSDKGTLPSHCAFTKEFPMKSQKRCRVEFSFSDDKLALTVQTENSEKFEYRFDLPENKGIPEGGYRLHREVYRNGKSLWQLELINSFAGENQIIPVLNLYVQYPITDDFEIEAIRIEKQLPVKLSGSDTAYRYENVPLTSAELEAELIAIQPRLNFYPDEILKN